MKNIKRTLAFFLAIFCLLSLVACGEEKKPVDDKVYDTPEINESQYKSNEFDFSILNLSSSKMRVRCTNKLDYSVTFRVTEAYINGYQVGVNWELKTDPSSRMTDTMEFPEGELKAIGIESPQELKLHLVVAETQGEQKEVFNDVLTFYPAEASSVEEVVYVDRKTTETEMVMIDTPDAAMVILGGDPEAATGYEFNAYIENKTDKTLVFAMNNVKINGKSLDPKWGKTLVGGTRAYTDIGFTDDEFKNAGIKGIDSFTFELTVYVQGEGTELVKAQACEYTFAK